MGLFDEVSVFCPSCNAGQLVQSKASDHASLRQWTIYKAPIDVLVDIAKDSPITCPSCGHGIVVEIQHMVSVH